MPTPPEHEIRSRAGRLRRHRRNRRHGRRAASRRPTLRRRPRAIPCCEQVVVEDVGGPRYVTTATGERCSSTIPGGRASSRRDVRAAAPAGRGSAPLELAHAGARLHPARRARDRARGDPAEPQRRQEEEHDHAGRGRTPSRRQCSRPRRRRRRPSRSRCRASSARRASDAERALDTAGLAVVVATVPGPAPAGQVLAQNPAAGGTLKSGDSVRHQRLRRQAAGSSAAAPQTPATPQASRRGTHPRRLRRRRNPSPARRPRSSSSAEPVDRRPSSAPQPTPVARAVALRRREVRGAEPRRRGPGGDDQLRPERRAARHRRLAVAVRRRDVEDGHAHHAERRLGARRQGAGDRSGPDRSDDQAGGRDAERRRAAADPGQEDRHRPGARPGKVVEQTPSPARRPRRTPRSWSTWAPSRADDPAGP